MKRHRNGIRTRRVFFLAILITLLFSSGAFAKTAKY